MRTLIAAVSGSTLIALAACSSSTTTTADTNADTGTSTGTASQPVAMDEGMGEVMREKRSETHDLLDAVVMADYPSVESHALALHALSERSEWKVHDTMAYAGFSDQFRSAAGDLAEHAGQEDHRAVSEAFGRLTASCLNCHAYLRREQLIREMPGSVSWLTPAPDAAAPASDRNTAE